MVSAETQIEVIKPGTAVQIRTPTGDTVPGYLNLVQIEASVRIQYCVQWWDGRSCMERYFDPDQVDAASPERSSIGFSFTGAVS